MNMQKHILLAVDDSPTNLELIKGLFSRDYDIRLAKSGAMALSAVSRVRPDIVLLDIELADMSGLDVLSSMRNNPAMGGVSIIVVTSHKSDAFAAKARELGADGYIIKPYRADDLRSAIRKALQSRRV